MITRLLHHERPLALYSTLATLAALTAVALGIPVIAEYLRTGFVGRFPTAFLAASLVVVAFIVLVVGILLDGLRKVRQETTRIAYMAIPAPPRLRRPTPASESTRSLPAHPWRPRSRARPRSACEHQRRRRRLRRRTGPARLPDGDRPAARRRRRGRARRPRRDRPSRRRRRAGRHASHNGGFGAGCAAGAAATTGEVLVFVNSDAVVRPGALRALSATARDPPSGSSGGLVVLADRPDTVNSVGLPVHLSGLSWSDGFGEPASRHRRRGP